MTIKLGRLFRRSGHLEKIALAALAIRDGR
jgi:hypothetical protein